MDINRLQKIRPCGRLETYSTARHHLRLFNNVALTATYTSPSISTKRLETVVFAALHHVVAQHPNLSAIPVNEDRSYPEVYLARLPEINLRTCVEFYIRETLIPRNDGADDELDNLLSEQHSRNFDGNVDCRPYWRLAISSQSQTPDTFSATWIFHHALSDGASSMLFHQSFLDGLNASLDLNEASPIVKAPSTALLPPLEDLHPMTLSWPFFLRALAGSLMPSYFAPNPPNLWTGEPLNTVPESPRSTHITTIALSLETTTAFVAKCRAEKTSVTAVLASLLAAALSATIAREKDIKIGIPISLRRFLALQESQMMCMVNAISNCEVGFLATSTSASTSTSTSTSRPPRNPSISLDTFSWSTAQRVKREFDITVAKQGADNPVALLKYVSDIHAFFSGMQGQRRQSSGEVSNLGVWRSSNPSSCTVVELDTVKPRMTGDVKTGEAKCSLRRLTFSQSANLAGAPICLSAVTGADGCLVLCFSWAGAAGVAETEAEADALSQVPGIVGEWIELLVR